MEGIAEAIKTFIPPYGLRKFLLQNSKGCFITIHKNWDKVNIARFFFIIYNYFGVKEYNLSVKGGKL